MARRAQPRSHHRPRGSKLFLLSVATIALLKLGDLGTPQMVRSNWPVIPVPRELGSKAKTVLGASSSNDRVGPPRPALLEDFPQTRPRRNDLLGPTRLLVKSRGGFPRGDTGCRGFGRRSPGPASGRLAAVERPEPGLPERLSSPLATAPAGLCLLTAARLRRTSRLTSSRKEPLRPRQSWSGLG